MDIKIARLKQIISEEMQNISEQNFPPDRTGLSAGDWQGPSDPRGSGRDAFPETDPERLGDLIAASMEGGIRDVLQSEFGDERGIELFDRYLSDVDEDILRIAMIMRDHALDLTGEPEGYIGSDEEEPML